MPTDKPRFGIDYGKGESPGPVCEKTEVPHAPSNDERCFHKALYRGQATFTLVAQDLTSPTIIGEWIKQNIETCPAPKLYEALAIALKMRDQPRRKTAD